MRTGWTASASKQGLSRRWAQGVRAEVWQGQDHWRWDVLDAASTPLAHGLSADCERAQDEAEDVAQSLIVESDR